MKDTTWGYGLRTGCVVALIGLLSVTTSVDAAAATLTRGPYLQLLTTNLVTIVWNTDVADDCALGVRPLAGGPTTVLTATAGTVCAIPLTGLTPGTGYAYAPRAGTTALAPESTFQTDGPSDTFTFLVVGDTGSGGSEQAAVRDRMLASPADFIVHTGDMIYDNGEAANFNPRFFTPYEDLVARLVFWPCLGNHDVRTASGQPWRDAFSTPANNAAGSENYYSFDYGNAHVAVLNSNASTAPGSAQYSFLDQDLAASAATWKFVAFHHTIYSSGSHGSNTTIRGNLVPLFDRHGVDLVFMGHDHHYERTRPLRNNQIVAPGAGTVYVTTGGGGRDLYPVGASNFTAYAESAHHFTRVSVDRDALLLEMVRVDGVVRDEMGLVKGTAPTPTRSATPLRTATPVRTATPTPSPTATATLTLAPGQTPLATATATRTTTPTRTATRTRTPTPVLTPVGRRLDAYADTYIEAGTEASWSHGGSDHLDVDLRPFGVSYLTFNVSAETGGITSALLELHVTNASDDGGRIVLLPSSSWVEGIANGLDASSAGAVGLKWTDVDRNRDGVLDASDGSPLSPSAGRPIAVLGPVTRDQRLLVDVTSAFAAGPGVYTLAITNASSDGTTFGSRESLDPTLRPALHLTTAAPPPTATITAAPTASRTALPTSTPSAMAPTATRTAIAPTITPSTVAPTATRTAMAPTATPTTVAPTATRTAVAPTATRTAVAPTTTPTTVAPTATQTAVAPTLTPPAATPTATPPRTATPPVATRTATPPVATATATKPTPTATPRPTTTPAPDATSVPFACLSGTGPLIVLNGTFASKYSNHGLSASTRIDARAATFLGSPTNHYPINLAGGLDACIAGGQVIGQYDRTRSWDSMHAENNAGIAFDNGAFTIDGLRVDNVTDGIRPEAPAPFTIRHTWLSYVRDDCVENDHVQGGLIEDSLFDGCYVGLAERPTSSIITAGWDGRGQLVTIRRTMIHLAAMPGPRNGAATALGHEGFFKWSDLATNLALHDNVFMADQVGEGGASSMGMPPTLTSCSNNVMVWLGAGDYPAPLPACFTVTKDRAVWDRAVAAWKQAHPQVGGG